jgi:hypothetical protein
VTAAVLLSLLSPFFALDLLSDPAEIVRRLIENDRAVRARQRQYTYVQQTDDREFDKAGKTKKSKSQTLEISYLYGRRYERVIARDGRPLEGKDLQKEEEKFQKESAKRARESENDREKLAKAEAKQSNQLRELVDEIIKAYRLTLEGTEAMDGRTVYRIAAEPRDDYNRRTPPYSFLKRLRGRMWIDAEEFQLTRAQAEVIEDFSFGLILARMARGSTLEFEQSRVNSEVWMPKNAKAYIDGRFLVDRFRGESVTTWRDYRKFQTDSRVVDVAEVP